MRDDVSDGENSPAAKLPGRLRQRAQDQPVVQRVQLADHAGTERRNKISLRPRALHRLRHQLFHAPDFDLYIQESGASVSVEQLIQRGRLIERATRSAKLLERVPANYQVIEFGTMTDSGLPVASGTDVELKALSAMFQRQIESTQSILRSITPGAAMSDQ